MQIMHTVLTIVVAAGSGQRMGTAVPKQFLLLDGEPVVMRTMRRLAEGVGRFLTECSSGVNNVVENPRQPHPNHSMLLVLPPDAIHHWEELCRQYHFQIPHQTVPGGATRFHSVQNALRAAASDADVILVHDGVRPLVDDATLARVITTAAEHGTAVPVVPIIDSLRQLHPQGGESVAVDRSRYRAVQTPQGFCGEWLRAAYEQSYDETFTDDASVVERLGVGSVVLTDGSPQNLKITTPFDLTVVESWLRRTE